MFAQIGMSMKITEQKKSIAVSTSNVKLPWGKRIRDSLYIPRRIIGWSPRVSSLCDSNGHPAYNSAEFDLFYLIRLPSCASEVFFSPETDNRFEAVDAETLLEYFGLFRAALPLLIGIIVIGF